MNKNHFKSGIDYYFETKFCECQEVTILVIIADDYRQVFGLIRRDVED